MFADDTIRLEWLVVSVTEKDSLGGSLVDLRGRVVRSDGRTAGGATGLVLVSARRVGSRGC